MEMFDSFRIGNYQAISLFGKAAPPEGLFTVSFTGDFGFWNRHPSPEAIRLQLEAEQPLLSRFDLRVINLEFILPGTGGGNADLECESVALSYLMDAGFQIVSLANNHAAAFGPEGLQHNVDKLEEAGISVIGLSDRRIHMFEKDGFHYGIYALTDLLDDADPHGRVLRSRTEDVKNLHAEMDGLHTRIGFPHLGSRSVYPSPHEISQAGNLFDSGTDLLVCTGAHFAKGFVHLNGKPVCFGLGNHLFAWEGGGTEPVGMHLVASFDNGELQQLFALPFHNTIMSGQTGPLDEKTFKAFSSELADRSTTDTSRFYSDPRTQEGAMERLRNLRLRDLINLRPRHVTYGLRALFAKLMRR
jgi:hypothetical protein